MFLYFTKRFFVKNAYIFVVIAATTLPMEKPAPPSVWSSKKPAAKNIVWAKKTAAMVKPAAAGLLKRLSDEEREEKKSRRRRNLFMDGLAIVPGALVSSHIKTAAQTTAEGTRQEILQGGLRIISSNPPICEVMQQSLAWKCRYGCRREFKNKHEENAHIRLDHHIIPANLENEWGIDWEEVNTLKDPLGSNTPPLPEDEQEEVEEMGYGES